MSRLLDSGENERIRDFLESRNLYTPNDPYNVNSSKVVNVLNTIAKYALPFKSIDVRNTLVGRALGVATGNETPLANIGAQMLGKQLLNTAASAANAAYFPSFTFDPFNRIYDPFKRKIDYEITRREDQNAFGRFFQNITRSYRAINPFNEFTTNKQFIRETGVGQIQGLVINLNRNWFTTSDIDYLDALEEKKFAIDSFSTLNSGKVYFTQNRSLIDDPYNYLRDSWNSNLEVKANELISRQDDTDRSYIRSLTDVSSWYGVTTYLDKRYSLNEYNALGLKDDINNQIVWGRDGTKSEIDNKVRESFIANAQLRGDSDDEISLKPDKLSRFNARRGLLQYTSELLNASEGKFVDQTRKIFKSAKNGSIVGKQGSGLPIPPSNDYTKAMESYSGVRQHTVVDQYNRFGKTIRFVGNSAYGGHENSIIYDTVMPKITPYTDDPKPNFNPENNANRNLMFSIENLAFELDDDATIESDIYGKTMKFLDCQKGPNRGRLMWFAPYDVDVTEQAVARYTETQFIGRGEPVYTYSNSERIMTVSFKLLIDHPEQSKNRKSDRSVREFFAFGGEEEDDGEEAFNNLPNLNKMEAILISEINALENKVQINPIPPSIPDSFDFFFPNDIPIKGSSISEIENLIESRYEITNNPSTKPSIFPKNYGKNNEFELKISSLVENFLNPTNGKLYSVDVIGWTSELASSDYNDRLGFRRALSLEDYLRFRIKTRWNQSVDQLAISINSRSEGEVNDPSTEAADSIDELNSVVSRRAEIKVSLITANEKEISNQQSPDEKQTVKEKKEELQKVKRDKHRANGYNKRKSTTCGFNKYTKETNQQLGYDSFIRENGQSNLFQPIFYSQTPKDFHDRLTFLNQCTRQGPAVRKSLQTDKGKTTISAKNSVFGRQPICVLRLGDQWYSKVIIENIQFSYSNAPWDTNPEGYGMQFMSADITMQMKIIGGQSLYGPISALQNAITFNYYANSTFAKDKNYESKAAYHFEKEQKKADIEEFNNRKTDEENKGPNTEAINVENLNKE